MKVLICLLLIASINEARTAKILGVFPMPSGSHYILGSSLMTALAEKGHDVTFISPFETKNPPKNGTYRDIILTGFVEKQTASMKELNMFDRASVHPVFIINLLMQKILNLTEKTLGHENVQKLLNSKETFDVVIVQEVMNQAHKGFAAHFNASLITFSTVGICDWVNTLVANPSPLSYIPELMVTYSSNMTFFERFINGLTHLILKAIDIFYLYPKQEEILKKYFPNSPDFYDVLYNSSLVLSNSHPSINQPVPFVPSIIQIGGYHVKPPKKLPKDLQEFLDSAKNGVIYFSMGSNLIGSDLPLEKRKAFLDVFSKLREKVLWKWEDEELPGKPDNVKIGKWLPQQDILAHPNVKLFITHGGLLSTIETIYHGVPTLTIPIFGDQMANAARAANNGFALVLPFSDLTETTLSEKIKEMLHNPKYSETAKFRSKIFHDQPIKPMEKAIYWVEYIVRHGKADHLKVAGLKLPWYKYHLLDVIAFAVLIILTINILLVLTIKKICFRKRQKLKTN